METITYRVDAEDLLVEVGGDWHAFASENGCSTLTPAPLGRSLWSFVTGAEARMLWQGLLARARAGERVSVPYRCDAPAFRRFLTMQLEADRDDSVLLTSGLVLEEERTEMCWLAASAERASELVRSCSWCRSFAVGDEWVEVEEAVARLRLLEAAPPQITHTLCPGCAGTLAAELPAAAR